MACNSLTFMANRFTAARCVCSSPEGWHYCFGTLSIAAGRCGRML